MFSSNPFPQLTSSIHVFPPPVESSFNHGKIDVYSHHHHHLCHHHHNPFFSGDGFVHGGNNVAPPPPPENMQDFCRGSRLPHRDKDIHLLDSVVCGQPKKDRHSKIHTAQGPRDRRVRLSIEISRKFFGLQDLLGFDKASKTLDWLFTKSKTAIKDLVEEMKQNSSSSVTNQCEVVFMEERDESKGKKKKKPVVKSCVNGKKKKMAQKSKGGGYVNLAKTKSRAEARARARERTREKLRIKKLDDESKKVLDNNCYAHVSPSNFALQSSCGMINQIESQSNHKVKLGESIMEQKFPMPSSMLYSSQQNLAVLKDSSSQIHDPLI